MTAEAPPSASRPDILRALRSAAFTGLIASGLFLPLIAFKAIHDIRNELVLETRWPLFATFVAIAFAARLIWELLPRERLKQCLATFFHSAGRLAAAAAACALATGGLRVLARFESGIDAAVTLLLSYLFGFGALAFAIGAIAAWLITRYPTDTEPGRRRRHQIGVGLRTGALGFLLAYPLMMLWLAGSQGAIKWIDNFGIQILIYVMLGWGLNIVVGLAGLLDLGYVAFYAVGAYSYALLAKTFGLSFWILLPLAGILAAFWGVLLGFPVLRLRGDYLAIVTLAFGEIIRLVLINWVDLTNGYAGISGMPRPSFFGAPFTEGRRGLRRALRPRVRPDLPHHLPLLRHPGAGADHGAHHHRGCGGCRSAAPGRRCARTRSPAARSASTPPRPSSPPSPSARCSVASPARSSRLAKASSRRRASPSWSRR